MARLEELTRGATVRGVLPDVLVTIVDLKWFGSALIEVTYEDAGGRLGNDLVHREREPTLEIVTSGRPWSFDGSGDLPRLVSEAHANYIETFRLLARMSERGAIEEGDGLVLVASGAPLGAFNPAFVTRPPADPASALARAQAFFSRHCLPWVLRVVGDVPEALATAAVAAELEPLPAVPGMLLAPLAGEPPNRPGVVVRVVEDAASLRTFTDTMAAGFQMPRDALQVLDNPGMLTAPNLTFYLGLVDGTPVATALRATSHRIAGVFNVSTVPAYRRRGLGEAMTWRAALDGRDEGCVASYLQASPMALPVYRRMGYRPVADYASWEASTARARSR